jgi:antitoxin component YwqK of YwqJK toxin-antitoxin module
MNIYKNIYLSALALLVTAQFSKAQEQKSSVLSDQTKVVYGMNDSKKIEGAYSVLKDDDKVFLRGVYKDNLRVGNWYAFNDNGNVFLRYNYDLKKLLFLDTVSINRIKVDIASTDPVIKEKASIPVPIASIDQYISLLATELKRVILKENKSADGTLDTDLVTNIDQNGKATYEAHYAADGIPVTKRLIIAEKAFNIDWIPSSYNGKNYASVFSVKARIDFAQKPGIKQRFIWVY